MSTLVISTHGSTAALAEKLRGYGAKALARIVGTSPDTTKKWLSAANAPTWKHTVIMLNDDELCAKVLEAAGRADLARAQKIIAAEKNLAALKTLTQRISSAKAAENRHQEEAHEIRESIRMARERIDLDGRPPQRMRDEVATSRGVVPRSDDE